MLFPALAVLAGIAACGGDDDGDGDPGTGYMLEVLDPPGESVGLPFAQGVTLRVRYTDDRGEPVRGGEVRFAILATMSENTGGSALSTDVATTDDQGVASVDVVAGVERANFRVEASAAAAPTALFYVAVSEVGFTTLLVTALHDGPRPIESFDNVQVRLFMPEELRCDGLDPDALPESVFPPRGGTFDDRFAFNNLAADEPYTAVAWAASSPDGTKLALGCADLGAPQIPTGPSVRISLVVADRPLALPERATVSSTFGLAPVREALADAVAVDPWLALDCPLGAAQLLIDCTLDAHTDDGVLDCVPTGPDADGLIAAVAAQRGAPSAAGCRPDTTGAMQSLDDKVQDALAAGGWPAALTDDLVSARASCLDSFDLISEIEFFAGTAGHRLFSASVSVLGSEHAVDLTQTARPVLSQSQIASVADGTDLSLGAHAFTLRYGSIAEVVFERAALIPNGLAGRRGDLASAIAESVDDPLSTAAGCAGLSAMICRTGAFPATCTQADCNQARVAADAALAAWTQLLDGAGFDLEIAGNATLADPDDNLSVDTILGGAWQATFTLDDGERVNAVGSFQSVP